MGSLEPIRVGLQAVIVSDDDGGRAARVEPEDIVEAVAFVNRVFGPAAIGVEFSPGMDMTALNSTLLNDLDAGPDPLWRDRKRLGSEIAARYPRKITVLFRHGAGDRPTGQGFGWSDYAFVVMPGLRDASNCGHPHVDALAHEIGHYLGLPHTFAHDPFASDAEAEAYLLENDRRAECFDGDGFDDTAPDPIIRHVACSRQAEVTLAGVRFELPRGNIMSYYDERDGLSPEQVRRARWVLNERLAGGMALPVNTGARNPIEAELKDVHELQSVHAAPQSMEDFGAGDWSGDAQLFVGGRMDGSATLSVSVERTGSYELHLYATRAPDFGTVQVLLDDVVLSTALDLYAPIVMPTGALTLGRLELESGVHRLTFRVTGRNEASSNFYFGIDCLDLVP